MRQLLKASLLSTASKIRERSMCTDIYTMGRRPSQVSRIYQRTDHRYSLEDLISVRTAIANIAHMGRTYLVH